MGLKLLLLISLVLLVSGCVTPASMMLEGKEVIYSYDFKNNLQGWETNHFEAIDSKAVFRTTAGEYPGSAYLKKEIDLTLVESPVLYVIHGYGVDRGTIFDREDHRLRIYENDVLIEDIQFSIEEPPTYDLSAYQGKVITIEFEVSVKQKRIDMALDTGRSSYVIEYYFDEISVYGMPMEPPPEPKDLITQIGDWINSTIMFILYQINVLLGG